MSVSEAQRLIADSMLDNLALNDLLSRE